MKPFFKIISVNSLQSLLHRFPITLAFIFAWASYALLNIWTELDLKTFEWILSVSLAGATASLFCAVYCEAKNVAQAKNWLCSLLAALVFAAMTYSIKSPEWLPYFTASLPILALASAPFLAVKANSAANWWVFQLRLVSSGFVALIAALILGAGLSLIVWSLEALFGISFFGKDKVYSTIWLLSMSFMAPIAGINGILKTFDSPFTFDKKQFLHNALLWFSNLLCAPIVIVYALIIHAYAIMILVQWHVPNGEAGWLTLCFMASLLFFAILVEPLKPYLAKHAVVLLRVWPWLIPAPLIIMIIALNIRVAAYGVTIDRYFLGMIAIFFFAVFVAALRLPRATTLACAPIVLAVLLLVSSFGPWGAVQSSITSQVQRLQNALLQSGIISSDGEFSSLNKSNDNHKKASEIKSIIYYLTNLDALSKLEPIFADLKDTPFKDFEALNSGAVISALGLDFNLTNMPSELGTVLSFQSNDRNVLWQGVAIEQAIFNFYADNRKSQSDSETGIRVWLEGTDLHIDQQSQIKVVDLSGLRDFLNKALEQNTPLPRYETDDIILLITHADIRPENETDTDSITRLQGTLLYKAK